MDDGEKVLKAQAELLRLFLLLPGRDATPYVIALTLSIAHWSMWKASDHPVWKMFRDNACAFNEEAGEVGFSALARSVAKQGGIRCDVTQVNKRFRLLRETMRVANDVGMDMVGDDFNENGLAKVIACALGSGEIQAAAAFMKLTIRQLQRGCYKHLTSLKAVKSGQKQLSTQQLNEAVAGPPVVKAVVPQVDDWVVKIKDRCCRWWVHQHGVHIWPDAIPVVSDHVGLRY